VAAGKLTKTGKIGFIAGYPVPDVLCAANALLLGARTVNPTATCNLIFLNSWYDPPKEGDSATVLVDQGCDVIASMTDTPASAQQAERKGAWSIGYASDLSAYAPSRLITSCVLDWSGVYISAARDVLAGTWKPTDRWDGLKEGVVKMSPYNSTVPAEVTAVAAKAEADIKAGALHPWRGEIRDQSGKVRVSAGQVLADADIRTMNWLVEGVTGNVG
jgi:basic membrane lipoprotein Med (substrate-binding protein (PBP1-ABC) superfamily)